MLVLGQPRDRATSSRPARGGTELRQGGAPGGGRVVRFHGGSHFLATGPVIECAGNAKLPEVPMSLTHTCGDDRHPATTRNDRACAATPCTQTTSPCRLERTRRVACDGGDVRDTLSPVADRSRIGTSSSLTSPRRLGGRVSLFPCKSSKAVGHSRDDSRCRARTVPGHIRTLTRIRTL